MSGHSYVSESEVGVNSGAILASAEVMTSLRQVLVPWTENKRTFESLEINKALIPTAGRFNKREFGATTAISLAFFKRHSSNRFDLILSKFGLIKSGIPGLRGLYHFRLEERLAGETSVLHPFI